MIRSERATLIDEYVKAHADSDLKIRQPMEISGQRRDLTVYRLPISLLTYSIRNGRFAAELFEEEASQNRKIGETKEDLAIIRRLLLEQSRTETEALKKSLRQIGQLYPGVITDDGYVINGNRRMAVLEKLYEEEHLQKHQYLEVARLPTGVEPKDLWRIEAGIQLSKEDKLEYGPVNERLKLKEGLEAGLDQAEISKALFGRFSPEQVKQRLDELQIIEDYLDFIGQPKQYRLVERRTESFIDIRAGRDALEEQGKSGAEIFAYVQMGFEMVKSESSHWDIRDLSKIFKNGGEPAKSIADHFSKGSKDSSEKASIKAMDLFESAKEVYDAEQDMNRPLKLVKKALNTLQPLKADSPSLKNPETREALTKLWHRVYKLMKGSE